MINRYYVPAISPRSRYKSTPKGTKQHRRGTTVIGQALCIPDRPEVGAAVPDLARLTWTG